MNPEPKKAVRVRFAPSPTGPFSVGNARTAIFNWLYARHEKGEFLLRIEDTDKERSKPEYEKEILEGLKWLGLEWDEEIYRQSERTKIYETHLKKLLDEGKAYYCFCTADDLEAERQAFLAQGVPPKYSGRCKKIDKAEAKTRVEAGESAVIRFKMPESKVEITDAIRGKVSFDTALIGDIVIAKDLERPLYNFAVVVDDEEMKITHVIRGEDHLSNTPKQIAIQKALGFKTPKYAHLPLILDPKGGKLSKRLMALSISELKEKGFLSGAVFNFLVLLGWHPKEDKEVVSKKEAIETFTLSRVQKGGARMNQEKLDWLNGYYIRNSETKDLIPYLKNLIPKEWLKNKTLLKKVLEVEKERMKTLTDLKELANFFFELPDYSGELLVWSDKKKESKEALKDVLTKIKDVPEKNFTKENLNKVLNPLSEKHGKGETYWPFRVALSGKKASPGGPEIAEVLGKEETVKRLELAVEKL